MSMGTPSWTGLPARGLRLSTLIRQRAPAAWVPFQPPKTGRKLWRYAIADENNIYAPNFMAVNVFGTVLNTIGMFEEEVPSAGAWCGALADRNCPSTLAQASGPTLTTSARSVDLQFFFFDNPDRPGKTVYTACHATSSLAKPARSGRHCASAPRRGHSPVAGIARGDCDLVAVVMSFRSRNLCAAILKETAAPSKTLGHSRHREKVSHGALEPWLARDLRNKLTMDDVDHAEPHALSQVLSAALYNMIIGMHQRWWQKFSGEGAALDFSASGKALAIAADHFKRMVFRALDYLPPAEVSFADYGRAIIAADQASHPDDDQERQFIPAEFVKRGIVTSPKALDIETDFEHAAVKELDLDALVSSDAVAADFANRNRDLLHIPDGALFQVAPRLNVTKLQYHRDGQKQRVRECLLKVRWTQFEPNPIGRGWPQTREIHMGTTLAIDWKTQSSPRFVDYWPAANGQRRPRANRWIEIYSCSAWQTRASCKPANQRLAPTASPFLRLSRSTPPTV